jgi:hypothetical protein
MPKSANTGLNALEKKKRGVVAKSEAAGKTNKINNSLIRCEVKLENGAWVAPESCAIYKIDSDAKFPQIVFEIQTDDDGPYQWSWKIEWSVLACPQRRDKTRFKPKKTKTFIEKGNFASASRRWEANLNHRVIGGELTVKVKAGARTFVRKVVLRGTEPGEEKILKELASYNATHPREAKLAAKIFKQETKFCHFFSDEQPLVSFDNGYGLGQATAPEPTFEQAWNWKEHIAYIVTTVIKAKRALAKKYLDEHGNYTDDDLDMETLVFYNGANYHYLIWDKLAKKWQQNKDVICDPDQSNTGWDLSRAANKNKSVEELRNGEGSKPKYTGRCYAEHIKNHQ